MGRILLAQEGPLASQALLDELQCAGYEVESVDSGAAALDRMLASPPILTLLGIDLPRVDGLRILEKVRCSGDHDQPVILLTAREKERDLLRAFELGADDYVHTPFSTREVVARVRSVLRHRVQRFHAVSRPVAIDIEDARGTVVLEGGHRLALTRREILLLQALAQEPGRVCSRSDLLEAAFPLPLETSERTVDVHIKNLRKKLTSVSPAHRWIRSIYGVGFVWDAWVGADR